MPTNLPPEYFEAEKRYKQAESVAEKIACLEEMLSAIPKHKGTDKLRADYRRRLSKLKSSDQGKKSAARHISAFRILREGAGQVTIAGPANTGKSSLVRALTNAAPEVASSPYTTWEPTPGMLTVDNVQIQLVDTPPLDRELAKPELFDLLRRSDLILLLIDLQADIFQQLEDSLNLLVEHNILPTHLAGQYPQERRMAVVPVYVVVNKVDDAAAQEDFRVFCELLGEECPLLPISVQSGFNLERFKQMVFEQLGIIRVYSKAPGKEPDMSAPFVMKKGGTVEEFAGKIHKDFLQNLKYARVWGSSAFDGQKVPRDYVLQDGDIVELRA